MMTPGHSLSHGRTLQPNTESLASTYLLQRDEGTALPVSSGVQFRTSRDGVLRTVGSVFQLPIDDGIENWGASEARVLWRMHERSGANAAARGKVAYVDHLCRSAVYQMTSEGESLVACGNATAAAAAMISRNSGAASPRIHLRVPGASITVDAATRFGGELSTVDQIWTIHAGCSASERLIGAQPVHYVEFLNSYLIVPHPLAVDPSYLMGLASRDLGLPLPQVKVAVVDPSNLIPSVEFYGANGRHGAAPQTGLVTLALAATTISWLRVLAKAGVIQHPGGIEILPKIEPKGSGMVCAHMPSVNVQFAPL